METLGITTYSSNTYQNKFNNNFKAKVFLHNNVVPYLQEQGVNIERAFGNNKGQLWVNAIWKNIMDLQEKAKGILYKDTPLVLSAKPEAFESVHKSFQIYTEPDAFMCMDGIIDFVPISEAEEVVKYSSPVDFKLSPNDEFVTNLIERFKEIPLNIAKYFHPYQL